MPTEGDAAEAGPSQLAGDGSFIASESFQGEKFGYVFKHDDCGLGYYKDIPLAARLKAAVAAQKAKPVVVKSSNSLLKSLQKRGSTLSIPSGVPKKAKTEDNKESTPKYLKEMERYKQLSCASGDAPSRPLVK